MYTIFKFNFKTVNEPGTIYATWVEARGKKRYCYGRGLVGNVEKPDCSPRVEDDPEPVNPVDTWIDPPTS